MQSSRPALNGLAKGDIVYVIRSANDARRRADRAPIKAEVTSLGRVWVTLEGHDGWRKEWRMRMDTQDSGTQYPGDNARFVTPAQLEWETRRNDAYAALRKHGIDLRRGSAWEDFDNLVALADFVCTHAPTEG